jgi:hypothetical protein
MKSRGRIRRFTLFGAVCLVQSAVPTHLSTFNALYRRAFELSFTRIVNINGIAPIPFVRKIFIGLLSDWVNLIGLGHRKPYSILGFPTQTAAFLLFPAMFPAIQFPLFIAVCLLAALGMSTYHTCTDGFSIDTTPEAEGGILQGIMMEVRRTRYLEPAHAPQRISHLPITQRHCAAVDYEVLNVRCPSSGIVPVQITTQSTRRGNDQWVDH